MSKKRDKPAMYFSTLEIENVKSFEKKTNPGFEKIVTGRYLHGL